MFVVIGTTTVDLFVTGVEHMPAGDGDEFTTQNLTFCETPLRAVLGGNGGSAFTLARLGAEVALCSAVGADRLGALACDWLREAGVDRSALMRSEAEATSTTVIVADTSLNRSSFHHPGATAAFGPEHAPAGLLERARALLISGYPLLTRWRLGELEPLLPQVDYLLYNEHELAACAETPAADEGAARLLAAGSRRLILKRGAQGATVYDAGAPPLKVPGFAVDARFTVGAGDAFNAGLLLGVAEAWPLRRAVRFANAVAARVVAGARGVLGSPGREQVEDLLARRVPAP